jgi:HSP20 family molecular chaperone IbpA
MIIALGINKRMLYLQHEWKPRMVSRLSRVTGEEKGTGMIKNHSRTWYQVMAQWYNAMRQVGLRYWSRRRVTMKKQGWLSYRVISGGPVHAVEETEAEVIIFTAFSPLALTEVSMELAGDRLLIQGKSPCAPPEPGTDASYPEGSYDMRIRSAVLPCAVDLTRASVMRKNDMVRITLPKKARGHLNRISG